MKYIYMKLPSEIKSYFSEILDAGKSYSVLKRYVDYNDDFSKTVTKYGSIENEHFWKEIEKLFLYLKNNKLWFFDIFSAQNILVYKKNEKEWVPIIIDYKRFGRRFYFQQINLILKSEKIKKMNRKYSSLIRRNPYI